MKKYLTILIVIFLCGITANSQSILPKKQADSLWKIWKNNTLADTLRLEAVYKYTKEGYLKKQPDSAIIFADWQYVLAIQSKNKYYQGLALLLKAAAYQSKVKYDLCESYILQSLELFEEISDRTNIANARYALASIYELSKKYSIAIIEYKKCLILQEELKDQKAIGTVLKDIGKNYYLLEDYKNAFIFLERSRIIREELGNKLDIVVTLGIIGNIHHNKGELDLALIKFKKCIILLEEIGNKQGISVNLNNVGNIYRRKGEYAYALEAYDRSLKIKEELGDKNGMAITLNGIGVIYIMQGNIDKALELMQKCELIYKELNNKEGQARTLNNLGKIYADKKDFEQALNYYKQSLLLSEELGYKHNAAASLQNIGIIYDKNKKYSLALAYLYKCLDYNTESEDGNAIGLTNYNIGYILKNKSDSAQNSGNDTFAIQLQHEALAYFYKAFIWQKKNGESANLKETCGALHLLFRKLSLPDSAAKYLSIQQKQLNRLVEVNFMTLSENEKQLYFAQLEHNYGYLYDFAWKEQKLFPFLSDSAYNTALLTKGLSLKSSTAMRKSILASKDTSLIHAYEKWILLKQKMAKYYNDGGDTKLLEESANELEKELILRSASFSDFDKLKKLTWKDVQASLKSNEAAIEFVHYENNADIDLPILYVAILIKPNAKHPEIFRLCNENELKVILEKISGNNQSFANSVYGTRQQADTALFDLIWKPIEKSLIGVKSIYYSPSGLLHKISFASICKDKNVFLCDNYQLNQMSSTSKVITKKSDTFTEDETYLLMGGINYDTDSTKAIVWDYLPGTYNEVEKINEFLNKKKYTVNYFADKFATEEMIKSQIPEVTIAHISTHGFFFPDPEQITNQTKFGTAMVSDIKFRGATNYANWSFVKNKNPLKRSGIVLAKANDIWERDELAEGEDGILTAQEVANLNLSKTKLVVLSACETGLGDIKGSEGVFGLQRAFKMAGAKHLIMSLWQVPDKETSEFMQLFYKNLIAELDINTAFSNTQKAMRKKYDPYFWGAFVLIE